MLTAELLVMKKPKTRYQPAQTSNPADQNDPESD